MIYTLKHNVEPLMAMFLNYFASKSTKLDSYARALSELAPCLSTLGSSRFVRDNSKLSSVFAEGDAKFKFDSERAAKGKAAAKKGKKAAAADEDNDEPMADKADKADSKAEAKAVETFWRGADGKFGSSKLAEAVGKLRDGEKVYQIIVTKVRKLLPKPRHSRFPCSIRVCSWDLVPRS